MKKVEFDSNQYDEIYASGGVEKIYEIPYHNSGYYPLFRKVHSVLTKSCIPSVLEVGCGTGGFAHLLAERSPGLRYRGFDFSGVAVQRAEARLGKAGMFFVGDARSPDSYAEHDGAIVCTEVLEHIDADLDVVAQWSPSTYCICSVPNFDADNHVRHFRSEEDVMSRYGALIDIEQITRVKKPYLSNISIASTLRALRWNRYRPRQLARIMGLASFDTLGGWFVFSGRRQDVCRLS